VTIFIAEAGVNHNGSVDMAFRLVDIANEAGADIVKFQSFEAEKVVGLTTPQADYQRKNTGTVASQREMLSKLQINKFEQKQIANYCSAAGIEFLSSAFDSTSLQFIANDIGVKRLKIASGEITNLPFVLEHARLEREIIISTGMANLTEIEKALSVIAFGLIAESSAKPSMDAFLSAYSSLEGKEALRKNVTILQCTSEYPAPIDELNLSAMNALKEAFGVRVGFSDHSDGILASIIATSLGASVIEKHFTLDKNLSGPDHKASLNPSQLTELILAGKQVKKALGSKEKSLQRSEAKNKAIARKSLVAAKSIKVGEIFSEENLTTCRPGIGMEPYLYWTILGSHASRAYSKGDQIDE